LESAIINHILPEQLLSHFSVTSVIELCDISNKTMFLEIHLEEDNELRSPYESSEYHSKGFSSTSCIQDFPLRGKAVYLRIKRRRWRHKSTKKDLLNDYTFIAQGAKLTKELSDFLKGTGRYQGRYDE